MTENAITEQLGAARNELKLIEAQVAAWQRKADIMGAKVEAFEISAKYLAEMQAAKPSEKRVQRKRMPSSDWVRIFRELYDRYNAGFGYDQIIGVAANLDIELKRASLRSKMMNLAEAGHIERLKDGEFRITEQGAEHFGLLPSNTEDESHMGSKENDPPEGGSDTGEATTSLFESPHHAAIAALRD